MLSDDRRGGLPVARPCEFARRVRGVPPAQTHQGGRRRPGHHQLRAAPSRLQDRAAGGPVTPTFEAPPAPQRCASSCSTASTRVWRSEEHTSELQSLMRISSAVFCLKKKTTNITCTHTSTTHNK